MSSKKITFSIPDWLYEGLKEHLSFLNDNYRIEDLFKAAAIKRFIEIGYLDEFGQPFPIPKLNINSVSTTLPSWEELKNFKLSDSECELRGIPIDK